ncbi:GIY-YIG nuclease family protein [Paraburkholderia sp. Ac-20347]|nr:GIY-YIG nuclease family protein [Paraburkholderia sp. Ac-20347]
MGKSIRIYLADGVATGIRHGEIVNWSGQGIACPRVRFPELKEWPETRRPGVYFLFGSDNEGRDAAYVGEAEDVFDRVKNHVQEKEFWNEVIAFTSKDDNLTKAHVRYLEAQLHDLACKAGRYAVQNSNTPQEANLPRGDRDAMKEFVEDVRVLLGVFGHRLLEPLSLKPVPPSAPAQAEHSELYTDTSGNSEANLVFYLRVGGISARAVRGDEGLVVLSGSEAALDNAESLSGGYKAHKERLIAEGIVEASGAKLRFTRDYPFSSPSQAAAIIVGYSINGRDAWKTESGRTYNEVENEQTLQLPEIGSAS